MIEILRVSIQPGGPVFKGVVFFKIQVTNKKYRLDFQVTTLEDGEMDVFAVGKTVRARSTKEGLEKLLPLVI